MRGKYGIILATAIPAGVFFLFAFPFAWMLFATSKTNLEIFTPLPLLPGEWTGEYFRQLFSGEWIPFGRQYINSLTISIFQTAGALLFAVPAGYLFATFRFPFRRALLFLVVLALFVPRQVLAYPMFNWIHTLGLLDTLPGVILPGTVSGLGVLYFTLVFSRLPPQYRALAISEGASETKAFLHLLPLVRNALMTFALIQFILCWHEHIMPMVLLSSPESMTLTVSLHALYGGSLHIPYGVLMAGSLFTVLPTVVMYILFRRNFRTALRDINT